MSVVSKFLEDGFGNLVKNIFLNAVSSLGGINIYVNTKFGKYIVNIEAMKERIEPEEEGIFLHFFIAFEGLVLRVIIKPNN